MLDVFSEEQCPIIKNDLFGPYLDGEKFLWAVGVFNGNGANETIKYALDARLEIFFPYRMNKNGNFVPLWKNYLFIEYIPNITISICKKTSKFINFINFNGQPELVYKNAIDECLKLLKLGKYNFIFPRRAYIEKGAIVRIMNDNNFNGKLVKLLCDVTPDMNDNKKVPVEIGNVKMLIEIGKLFI